jgi:hypothetical protein
MAMITRRLFSGGSGAADRGGGYAGSFEVIGGKEIDRILANIPKAFRKEAIEGSAKPGALMLRSAARQEVTLNAKNQNGQSKAIFLARNIHALIANKAVFNFGYNVFIKGKDIPVGDREWHIQGFGVLFGEGSYKVGERTTRKTKANRGRFRGFGNFIEKAAQRKGKIARDLMMHRLDRIAKATLRMK